METDKKIVIIQFAKWFELNKKWLVKKRTKTQFGFEDTLQKVFEAGVNEAEKIIFKELDEIDKTEWDWSGLILDKDIICMHNKEIDILFDRIQALKKKFGVIK